LPPTEPANRCIAFECLPPATLFYRAKSAIGPPPADANRNLVSSTPDRPGNVLSVVPIAAMNPARMRPLPELARCQLAAQVGNERALHASYNAAGRGAHVGRRLFRPINSPSVRMHRAALFLASMK